MGIYDGNKLANENLYEVAKLCVMAALKAPQVTGKVELKTEIITGEDTLPIIEAREKVMESRARLAPRLPGGTPVRTVRRRSSYNLRVNYDAGTPSVLIFFGTNSLIRSELNWNCGACGFQGCREFNKYSLHIKKTIPGRQVGPTCVWKHLDFNAALGWACAAAWQYNVDNRLLGFEMGTARMLGYMEDYSHSELLALGPCADLVWWNRRGMAGQTEEEYMERAWRAMPQFWNTFIGAGDPLTRYDVKEFLFKPKRLVRVEAPPPSPEMVEAQQALEKEIARIRARVAARRRELKATKKSRS